jgi:quinol monooxygenase YgiN
MGSNGGVTMKIGLLARIDAKPEHADEVEALLREAGKLAEEESGTVTWYSFRLDPTTFGVFDTFDDEQGRRAHLDGRIATALMSVSEKMLVQPPNIQKVDVLATKA